MKKHPDKKTLTSLLEDYNSLKDPVQGKNRILKLLKTEEQDLVKYLSPIKKISKLDGKVYPSQGLLETPFDYLDYEETHMLPNKFVLETLRMRRFFLELFNHPYRMTFLDKVNNQEFIPPPKIHFDALQHSKTRGLSLSIGDFAATAVGAEHPRISRNDVYAQGLYVKLGKQARHIFAGSESPDVWNSSLAIATIAACQCLATIRRNGVLSGVKRQCDVAKEVFITLEYLASTVLKNRSDKEKILGYWKNNVSGALEARADKALERATALYDTGVRSFSIYSPEPANDCITTTRLLRKKYGKDIEIITGLLVSAEQAKNAQDAGADALVVGVGGGGRCTTAIRSGTATDWPELVWELRDQVNLPILVQGGGTDHVAISLLLGVSGIYASRAVAGGTIESPGGALYFKENTGLLFKPYGGEASARTKYLDGKLLPFAVPSFVEGETNKAYMRHINYSWPTLTYNLHVLLEDMVLALVFRGVKNLYELHAVKPTPLRRITTFGEFQRNTH
ncbi:MAG TPA: IMP dehydrogenase [Candidatus Dojkabacteria bacterium]|nr:IMP dehydrogenase [Candidatus Dojkabacteria bacterium]